MKKNKVKLKPRIEAKIRKVFELEFGHFWPQNCVAQKTVENQKVTTRHIIESDTLNIIKSELELRVKLVTEETCWLKKFEIEVRVWAGISTKEQFYFSDKAVETQNLLPFVIWKWNQIKS